MIPRLLPVREMTELRELIAQLGFNPSRLEAEFGTSIPPGRAFFGRFMHATRDGSGLALFARALLAGRTVAADRAAAVWPCRLVDLLIAAKLLERDAGSLRPCATLVPLGELLFASDAFRVLDGPHAAEFVLPASTHATRYLLDLMLRESCADLLDLGTGCGVHALVAASDCERVVASDLNPRATSYVEFNAMLNACTNVECLTGDLFEPVAGRKFDLIVSNPPFVPAPGERYLWRESGMSLDGLARKVIREAPEHMREGGLLQMLCEWVEIEGEPWQDRLAGWLEGLGCDAWVLRSPPQDPRAYAALRVGEIAASSDVDETGSELAHWIDHFAEHRVRAIHPAVIVLRRRRGRNWLHVQPVAREIRAQAGSAVRQNIRGCDFLAAHTRIEELLDALLIPAPDLAIEQSHRWSGAGWQTVGIRAWLTGPLPFDVELDAASAAFLREFDGTSTVRECFERFASLVGDPLPEVRRRCAPIVRLFLERGLLRPPSP